MRISRARAVALVAGVASLASVALAGCASDGLTSGESGSEVNAGVALPPTSGTFDYQLGEPYAIDGGIDVVARDSTAAPEPGAYSICYVNGFQTQPGEAEAWLGERGGLLLRDASGEPVIDPDWPDEYILDPSTSRQRDGILAEIEPVITGCAEAGFDAVEVDNLDTFTRFGAIDETGALELARAYVDVAHASGLAIGQKNSAELADRGRDELGFDFAVTEECSAYAECGTYSAAYGEQVLQIEYLDNLPAAGAAAVISTDAVCGDPDRAPLTIIRDRDLVGVGAEGYFYQQC
ncbi:endo alpha-1,4 polygalactosaminidase [Pseudoclavibacter terrae]|uniref:Endo alpha-1,4 polygalactosaminidase n=1 Tax=Pseudoclavibacter terrae TaxID=1530195 RepID=A0A7J5B523_9MICO|nr:endo alpha-1,4 polygalactosaminidase [Pseudoclavibacter terrae]KAB1639164.1 endo alpha-1,4 polygalactosaminidase [Pseudoclavibacter terrae]